MKRTTLGEIAKWSPPSDQEVFYNNVVNVLDDVYPPHWRSWVINETTYEDMFGEKIACDKECRLRFAIPTMSLASAFNSTSLSERKYKLIKRIMLKWPLGRALIYAPFDIAKMVHPTDAYNGFLENVQTLKPRLISRHEASSLLRKSHDPGTTPASTDDASSLSHNGSRRRSHSPSVPNEDRTGKRRRDDEMTMSDFMRQQQEMFAKLCSMISAPVAQSLSPERRMNESDYESEMATTDSWRPPPLGGDLERFASPDPADEQLELFDFAPQTKETEAKIGKADEGLVAQGIDCQRLNSDNWGQIKYNDVQKQFQATPVFTSLKINGNLATVTPPWQIVTTLEKTDLCLGAITHGLLQQRRAFENSYKSASLEVKAFISKNFLASDSDFRRTSDALLQYTCGKRCEILQQRRNMYKTTNKTIDDLLHSIPPSPTHLFAEPQLSEFVKEQGGVTRLFRGKPKQKPKQFVRPTFTLRERRPENNNRWQWLGNPEKRSKPAGRRPQGSYATQGKHRKPKYETKKY